MSKMSRPDAITVLSDEWIPLAEATAALGKSERSLYRLVQSGHLRTRPKPRPGGKPETMFHAGDLDRIKQQNIEAARIEPTQRPLAVVPPKPPQRVELGLPDALGSFLERIIKLQEFANQVNAETAKQQADAAEAERELGTLWLSLEEAAAYSGLTTRQIRAACKSGRLAFLKAPFRISRASLEAFKA